MPTEEKLKSLIRDVPDFPKPGVIFKDITPLLSNPDIRRQSVVSIAEFYRQSKIDALAATEARGFIFGTLLAHELHVPFIPVRKLGKLPYDKIQEEYALEYGTASIEMHADAVKKGWNVLVHDDLLATGGTSLATASLIEKLGGVIQGFSFIVNLAFLPGEKAIIKRFGIQPHYLIKYS